MTVDNKHLDPNQTQDSENNKEIEKLEAYYFNIIFSSLGDKGVLKRELESQNKLMTQVLNPLNRTAVITNTKSIFDQGAERVIYHRLNKTGDLGTPNSAPIGADLFYEIKAGQSEETTKPIFISIDLKTVRANTGSAIGDVIGDIPCGRNQTSYKCKIKYQDGQIRDYTPKLQSSYTVDEQEALVLSYLIVVLYDLYPDVTNPEKMNVLMISQFCVPNGKLENHYKERVFNPGKTSDLQLSPDQNIHGPDNKTYSTRKSDNDYTNEQKEKFKKNDKMGKLSKKWKCSEIDIFKKTKKMNDELIKFENLDGRFNYIKCPEFELYDASKKRYKVNYFDNNMKPKYLSKLKFYKDNYSD